MEKSNLFFINIAAIVASLVWINWNFIKHGKEFWSAIKGSNKKLDPEEIAILIWIKLFPIVTLGDLFMSLTVAPEVWYSLDFILFALIAGNVGREFLKNKNS